MGYTSRTVLSLSSSAQTPVSQCIGSVKPDPIIRKETQNFKIDKLTFKKDNTLCISGFDQETTDKDIYSAFSQHGPIDYFQIYYWDDSMGSGIKHALIRYNKPKDNELVKDNSSSIKINGKVPIIIWQSYEINEPCPQNGVTSPCDMNSNNSSPSNPEKRNETDSSGVLSTISPSLTNLCSKDNGIPVQRCQSIHSKNDKGGDTRKVLEISNLPAAFQCKDLYDFLSNYIKVSITFVFPELDQNGKRFGLAEFHSHWVASKICQDLNNFLIDDDNIPLIINFSNLKSILYLYADRKSSQIPNNYQLVPSQLPISTRYQYESENLFETKRTFNMQALKYNTDFYLPFPDFFTNHCHLTPYYKAPIPIYLPGPLAHPDKSLFCVSEKNSRLYFRNYNTSVIRTDIELRRIFEPFGVVSFVNRVFGSGNTPRGFAFIQFLHAFDGYRARIILDGSVIDGYVVKLLIAKERTR
ncbi:hypothetical protein NADFUDRAFT_39431 [Nadsonia fulvescens var. elongata DSM 6958]|uniref:RRM domain-containing protein n=1 Tax=Nadsonia fulvescens var. elongata DSM 6958 TaxID=857566 RepID=A0A1E3PS08_9ASCO|nr:hypothetical protein NADFUDRAFT_39431 [Nadsonia fulvescens var. elongata DSM 6958]